MKYMKTIACRDAGFDCDHVVEGVTVNSGAEYQACVMTTKNLELLCKTAHNSPASRPEFIDINLDEVTASGTERIETEEQQARIEEQN